MSEKRFKRAEFNDGTIGIKDNVTQDKYYYAIDCLDLLNSQEEQIKDLKSEIRSLRKWGKFLEKENEELRKRNERKVKPLNMRHKR